jgi:ADP-ribose pyrophosphatase YjhB (NUDIX family)
MPSNSSPAEPHGRIVSKVLGLFLREQQLLALCGVDPATGLEYWRPLGGTIEFGESSAQALRREMREELGAEIEALRLLGVIEAHFSFDGRQRHEMLFVYFARFADARLESSTALIGVEADGTAIQARWVPLEDARQGRLRLVPEGLLELVDRTVD